MKIILSLGFLLGILISTSGCLNTEASETVVERKMIGTMIEERTFQCREIRGSIYSAACIDLVDCFVDGVYAQRIVCANNVIVR